MTKTEAVSKLLDKNPTITAKEGVAELKKKGVEINEQGFYNYRNLWKKSKGETGTTATNGESATATATPKATASPAQAAPKKAPVTPAASMAEGKRILATLQKLEELAAEVGGYGELKNLIDFLEK